MFAFKSTVERLERQNRALDQAYSELQVAHLVLTRRWNDLVERINDRGGESFLNSSPSQLTEDDFKKLLMLCHPDKHGGKKMAEDMTKRLLELRAR